MRIGRGRAALYCILGALLWGLGGTSAQYLMAVKAVPAEWLSCIRLGSAGLVTLVLVLSRKAQRQNLYDMLRTKSSVVRLVLFTLFGLIGNQIFYLYAIRETNAGVATVIQYTAPALMLIYTCIRERKRPQILELACLFLALAGTVLIATHGNFSHLAISTMGLIWAILAAFALCIFDLAPIVLISRYGSLALNAVSMLLAALVELLIFRLFLRPVHLDWESVQVFAVLVLISTVTPYLLFMKGLERIGAVQASMFTTLEPVAATFFSAVFLATAFAPLDLVGCGLVALMVLLLALAQRRRQV